MVGLAVEGDVSGFVSAPSLAAEARVTLCDIGKRVVASKLRLAEEKCGGAGEAASRSCRVTASVANSSEEEKVKRVQHQEKNDVCSYSVYPHSMAFVSLFPKNDEYDARKLLDMPSSATEPAIGR